LFQKNAEKFKNNKNIMTIRTPWEFSYTLKDFQRKYFTEIDISIANCLVRDSFEWRLVTDLRKTGNIGFF
jgi:hypothetical protein